MHAASRLFLSKCHDGISSSSRQHRRCLARDDTAQSLRESNKTCCTYRSVRHDKMFFLMVTLVVIAAVHEAWSFAPIEARQDVEFYDDNGTIYAIYMEKVSWREARKICLGQSGSLLEILDDDVYAFMSQALADSVVGPESLWIGGEFIPGVFIGDEGEWKWSSSGQSIEAKLDDVSDFPMTSFPYWVDKPDVLLRSPMCLSTNRKRTQQPVITAEPCANTRQYICKLRAQFIGSNRGIERKNANVSAVEYE